MNGIVAKSQERLQRGRVPFLQTTSFDISSPLYVCNMGMFVRLYVCVHAHVRARIQSQVFWKLNLAKVLPRKKMSFSKCRSVTREFEYTQWDP